MPKVNEVHIDVALSNMSLGYHPTGMIAEDIFPVISVAKESDKYYAWNKGEAFRVPDNTKRADGTRSKRVGFTVDGSNSYLAEEYALSAEVTDRQAANADSVLNLRMSKSRRVKDLIMLDQEIRVATLLTTQANWASTNRVQLSGTQQWNNASYDTDNITYAIEAIIDAGREAIRQQTGGHEPNKIIIPSAIAKIMKRDVTIRDLIKYTHQNLLVDGDLPPILWNMKVLIPKAAKNTNKEGNATQTLSDVWGKHVVLIYAPDAPAIDELSCGYIFRAKNAAHTPWGVRTWREEAEKKDVFEVEVCQDEKLVSNVAGYFIEDAIA
ncbi:MAG: hypothetical protein WC737_05695 [Parcubacteria group bacterium]|jgi:hypothetical protein